MNDRHLDDGEVARLLAGGTLAPARERHARECPECRREQETFLALVAGAAGPDPGPAARARVRRGALERWAAGTPAAGRWRWWVAAAAVILAVLLPVLSGRAPSRGAAVDTDAVLRQVDAELAKDPLAAVASEDVVDVLVPVKDPGSERSVS